MRLRPSPLPIQFAGGIETKQDSKQVPATRVLDLMNATFIKNTTLAKRNGYRALGRQIDGAGARLTGIVGLARRGDELLTFTADRCYSHRPSVDRWADAGEVASVIATDRPIARTGTEQSMPDHATNGGVTALAWEDSNGGVWCEVIEALTGRVLLSPTQLDASGQAPRCVPCGSVVHVLWTRPSISRIYCAVINPVTPGAAPTALIVTDDLSSTNPCYDAVPTNANDDLRPAAIVWVDSFGHYRVGYMHPAGMLGSPVSGLPSVAEWTDEVTGGIAVAWDQSNGGNLAVAWAGPRLDHTEAFHVRFHDPEDVTVQNGIVHALPNAPIALRVVCEFDAGGLVHWAAEMDGSRADLNYIHSGQAKVDGTQPVDATLRVLRGHCLVTRAFHDNGAVYAGVAHAVKYFPYVAFAKLSSDDFGGATATRIVARMEAGLSTGAPSRHHVASVHAVDPDVAFLSRQHAATLGYRIQLPVEDTIAASDQFGESGVRLALLDFDHIASHQTAELGRGLYLAGGLMHHYDGRRWAEADFHCAPDLADGAPSPAQATTDPDGDIAAGTYGYVFVYEEIDAQGELHPGAVSVPVLVVVGGAGTNAVQLTLPTYRLTSKNHVRIGVYRSPADQTGTPSEIPYYRVTSLDPETITGNNCYVPNDTNDDSIIFVDGLADADLLQREPLYTNGGIVSNDPAAMSGLVLAGGKSRLFWTDQTDPSLVRFSKTLEDDTAVEAPEDFVQQCDPYGGDIVGISVEDDAVIVLKESAVHAFGGPGPLANPDISADFHSFTPTALVTSDVGCRAPGSIVQTPVGVLFQSDKGMMLLDRTRAVQRIGNPVDAYNTQRIVRSTLLTDRPQIVCLTNDGRTLLWDYERVQWSTYTNHEGYDATIIGGVYHYLRTDGRVFAETVGVYRDDNVHIPMRIETAWVKAAGYLQGWQRILWAYFLGTYKSSHTLNVRYRLDYEEAWSPAYELDVDTNYDPALYGAGSYGVGPYGGAGGPTTVYQRRIHLNQRCQAIQFRIEDVEPTDEYGAAFELSELLLIGGVLGPAFKPGEARSD